MRDPGRCLQADARRIDRQRSTMHGLAYNMLPLSQEAAAGSGSVDPYPQPHPSPHHDDSTAGLNQDQAFLASHFPPTLPGNLGGTHQDVGGLGRAHSMPPGTRSPRQHMSAGLSQVGRPESPAPADLQGGYAVRNADRMARALRATQQPQQQAEVIEDPDVPGPESEQEEVGLEVAAPQAPAEGDLEAAIDALDAEAGLQGGPLHLAIKFESLISYLKALLKYWQSACSSTDEHCSACPPPPTPKLLHIPPPV